jgi:hypothetical protein
MFAIIITSWRRAATVVTVGFDRHLADRHFVCESGRERSGWQGPWNNQGYAGVEQIRSANEGSKISSIRCGCKHALLNISPGETIQRAYATLQSGIDSMPPDAGSAGDELLLEPRRGTK